MRSKEQQVWKLACGQPREPAAVVDLSECQASVPLDAVPPQLGGLEPFAAHRLHGIAEERFYMSDFDEHVKPYSRGGAECAEKEVLSISLRVSASPRENLRL